MELKVFGGSVQEGERVLCLNCKEDWILRNLEEKWAEGANVRLAQVRRSLGESKEGLESRLWGIGWEG